MTQHILVERAANVLVLTLNRPEKKNALTVAMYRTLATEIDNAGGDASIRCILILANGDMFTAGNDLADFAAVNDAGMTQAPRENPFLAALGRAKKPLVAAVNGRAVGVGVTMLLHCDMVYVSDDAQLTTPFVNLALVPEAASSLLMTQRIGHVRAFELFVLGEPVSAASAVSWGIANRAVPRAELHTLARQTAAAIAARAPNAVLAAKSLMRDESAIAGSMQKENALFFKQLTSPEFKEAFTAFSERRPADFSK